MSVPVTPSVPRSLDLAPDQVAASLCTGVDLYRLLTDLSQCISAASRSSDALHAVFALLSSQCGISEIVLEVKYEVPESRRVFSSPLGPVPDCAGRVRSTSFPLTISDDNVSAVLTFRYCDESGVPLPPGLCEAIAAQVASKLAIDELEARVEQANERLNRRSDEVAAIYEIGQAIDIEQIELRRLFQMITDRAAALLDAQTCSFMRFDGASNTLRVVASYGLSQDAANAEQPITRGIAGRVASSEQPLLIVNGISDEEKDSRLQGISLRNDIGSSMLVPVKQSDGTLLGVICIRRAKMAPDFNESDLKLLSVFASQATLAATNLQLYEDARKRANELGKLATLSRALISTIDIEQLLGNVADDIVNVVGLCRCCLYILDHSRRLYIPRVWRGYGDAMARNPVREREGVVGEVGRDRQMLYYDGSKSLDSDEDSGKADRQRHGFARSLGADSYVCVPVLNGKSDCIGVVVADNRGRGPYIDNEQRQLLSAFITQAGIAIDNALLYVRSQEDFQKIRRLTEYTENVLLSIPAGIISTDSNGKILRWNRAAEIALRQSPGSLRGHLLSEVLRRINVPERQRDKILWHFNQVLTTGESVYQYKLTPGAQSDGRVQKTLNVNLSRLTYHGEAHGVVLSLEDVTQEVNLRAQLEGVRRLADIGQLAAKMAHEVRNALSPIKGAAQIIRADMEAQGFAPEWPDIIIAEVDGLSRLTSAMLDFARPIPLDLRQVAPAELLTGCIMSLSSFLEEHRVGIQWQLEANMPELTADPVQIGQAVRNLVMNAAQSMPNGGRLTICAEHDQLEHTIVLSFRDTGIGVAAEQMERIFRPFVTTKPKGTGLGLPIVHKVVSMHGGRVDVQSIAGDGACFVLTLPLSPPINSAQMNTDSLPVISAQLGRFPDN